MLKKHIKNELSNSTELVKYVKIIHLTLLITKSDNMVIKRLAIIATVEHIFRLRNGSWDLCLATKCPT